jgi:hypothetical protein
MALPSLYRTASLWPASEAKPEKLAEYQMWHRKSGFTNIQVTRKIRFFLKSGPYSAA